MFVVGHIIASSFSDFFKTAAAIYIAELPEFTASQYPGDPINLTKLVHNFFSK